MAPIGHIALLLALLIFGALAGRIVLAAWRTDRATERWIAAAVLLTAFGLALEIGQTSIAQRLPTEARYWVYGAVQLPHVVAGIALYLLIWRVFYTGHRWAMAIAILGSAGVAICWLPATTVMPGTSGAASIWRLSQQTLRLAGYAWLAWAALAYYGRLQRRLRLGLVDSLAAQRFKLGGLAAAALAAILLLMLVAEQRHGVRLMDWQAGVLAAAPLGVFAAVAFYAAFFPPPIYRRWLEREHSGPDRPRSPEAGPRG